MDRRGFIVAAGATGAALAAGLPSAGEAGWLETRATRERRMAWWREARFGMFIHWGIYSMLGRGEWVRKNEQIPADQYDPLARDFNPTGFNAREWAAIAKRAGMKYLVITAKHHDGFSMFDSRLTNYDIVDATPFKRDPMKELAEACADEGVRFGVYYSIWDWHWARKLGQFGRVPNPEKYFKYMFGQVEELVTNYGPLGSFFFDGEWQGDWNPARAVALEKMMRRHQPDLVINDRIGWRSFLTTMIIAPGHDPILLPPANGDYCTPEQVMPRGVPRTDWETCMTMNDNWGWAKDDHNWKPVSDLIRKLCTIASKGGNFLLNIGPKPDGTIPEESVAGLSAVGDWLKVNGEAIYGTTAGPVQDVAWGRSTRKGNKVYLHVFEWPAGGVLTVPSLAGAKSARLLAGGSALPVSAAGKDLVIKLPVTAPDPNVSVIGLEV